MSLIPSVKGKASFSEYDIEVTAKSLKEAFKGFGTDEKRIIKDLLDFTNAQRQVIKEKYRLLFGRTLEEDFKDELTGTFEDICVALLLPRYEFEAKTIREATIGFGTKDNLVIDLLCTKESAEIEELKRVYKTMFNSNLEDDLKDEGEGALGKLYRSIVSGDRPTGIPVDLEIAKKEAQELYDAGEGQTGTEEDTLVRILVSRSFDQLKATFEEYKAIMNIDIVDSIKSEVWGDLQNALVAIIETIRNKPAYFAKRLHKVMQGPGVKDKELITILVSRCEIDMINIRQEYKSLFNRSLSDDLKAELSGHFEDIVLKLIGKNS